MPAGKAKKKRYRPGQGPTGAHAGTTWKATVTMRGTEPNEYLVEGSNVQEAIEDACTKEGLDAVDEGTWSVEVSLEV